MRPEKLKTRIFLDGGDPAETRSIKDILGFLDGQTTNPSFVAKSTPAQRHLERKGKFSRSELLEFYKELVQEISDIVPDGSVSVEVYADEYTPVKIMLEQAHEMGSWIPNAHIKFPTTMKGLDAARTAISEGIRVNMTLCFQQSQAAAVHAATKHAAPGDVFVSPFVGRLDDRGEKGMDLVANILRMYAQAGSHVQVLSASLRNETHLLESLRHGAHILTAKHETLAAWAEKGMPVPDAAAPEDEADLTPIPFEKLNLESEWHSFALSHPLTAKGLEKFAADWNALLKRS